jgi:AcrR family transcriptional regulator
MRNPEETKRRLLAAASAEFAAYGIAGARVDRIAEAAACNKQSIYAHFGSKEGLFDAVFDAMVVQTISAVPIDAYALPDYAARLYDWYDAHPEVLRLANWMQLERGNLTQLSKTAAAASDNKIEKILEAQQAGAITKNFSAEHLLALVLRLSTAQIDYCNLTQAQSTELRAAMIEAVRRLVGP